MRSFDAVMLSGVLALAACATTPAGPTKAVDLRDLDGMPVALETATHDATILVFWSTSCPCVARYRERIAALEDRWPARQVQVLAISSNVDDDLEQLRASAPPIRLLVDEDGRLARQVGARSTPTAVVLDAQGEVRYLGWIDNERLPGDSGREPWLEEAVSELLETGSVTQERAPTWGCAITRSLGEKLRCEPVERPADLP